jgi:Ca-activated chloride channel family protein
MSADEKAAAQKFSDYLLSPEAQKIAAALGLRPGTPGVALGAKFTPEFGVQAQARYDSLRSPQPQVVAAMLKSWQEITKKPSQVVVVVDSSGSMEGNKLPAVQQTLQTYIDSLGPKDQIALIDFDSQIHPPVLVNGTPTGRDRGIEFISSLEVGGGTKLYDSALYARNWLRQHLRQDAINAVLILTDGDDSESSTSLDELGSDMEVVVRLKSLLSLHCSHE